MILLSSVWQIVIVCQQASHIQWNSFTLNLWLLALKISLNVTDSQKKEVIVQKLFMMLLVLILAYSTGVGEIVDLLICSSRLLVLLSNSPSSYEIYLLPSSTYLETIERALLCLTPKIIDLDVDAFSRQFPVNLTRNSLRSLLEFGIIQFKQQVIRNYLRIQLNLLLFGVCG